MATNDEQSQAGTLESVCTRACRSYVRCAFDTSNISMQQQSLSYSILFVLQSARLS